MKVGTKPKRFFHDIVVLPRSEVRKIELAIEKHRQKTVPQRRPLVFDTVRRDDRIASGVDRLWQKEELNLIPDKKPEKKFYSLEEVAEKAIESGETQARPKQVGRPNILRNSLMLALQLSLVALMAYNALSLYFEKDWLSEKINNLALASKIRIARAESSIAEYNRDQSSEEINKAGISLLEIKSELLTHGEYNYLLPDHPLLKNDLSSGQNILELGLLIKDTNNDVNSILDFATGKSKTDQNLNQKAKSLQPVVARIKKRIARADTIIRNDSEVKAALGEENGAKIEKIIDRSKTEINKVESVLEVMPAILGASGSSRYLVLFMNNAEMRPGGGFPGNYGVVSFQNNNFDNIYISDIYYLDRMSEKEVAKINSEAAKGIEAKKQLNEEMLSYPTPVEDLSRTMDINRYFLMCYSNWNLDFSDNAKRADYLFEDLYRQGDVQGVIGLTPNVVIDILSVIGEIKMENYDTTISADNFREIMEQKVEFDNDFKKDNNRNINPKQILADFGPILMDKISQAELGQKIKIFETILKNAKQKQLVLHHEDSKVEELLNNFSVSGKIEAPDGDFLGLSAINLNAQKNGQAIDYSAKLKSDVSALGFAMNELSLTITHTETNPRELHQGEKGYAQIMVNKGSRLREARLDGRDFIGAVDYFDEAGHTVFGFQYWLEPGEAKNVIIKYQTPLKNYSDKGYSLNLFKQVGAKPIELEGKVNFEDPSLGPLIFREVIDSDKKISQ